MLTIDRPIILGSGSPRRKELLELMGLRFEIMKSEKEEIINPNLTPEEVVKSLALQKAEDIITKVPADAILITADTIVACEGKILGKPKDENDAYRMLKLLENNENDVLTGLVVWDKRNNNNYIDVAETKVYIKKLTDDEIWKYIKTGDPMDKAGAYGIQTQSSVFIDRLEGDYYNVMGLPISKLYDVLKKIES